MVPMALSAFPQALPPRAFPGVYGNEPTKGGALHSALPPTWKRRFARQKKKRRSLSGGISFPFRSARMEWGKKTTPYRGVRGGRGARKRSGFPAPFKKGPFLGRECPLCSLARDHKEAVPSGRPTEWPHRNLERWVPGGHLDLHTFSQSLLRESGRRGRPKEGGITVQGGRRILPRTGRARRKGTD